jgi:hypothetical protein
MSTEFRLQVATDPDRDDVVVELLYGEDVVASILEIEGEGLRVRIYSPPAKAWEFELSEFAAWLAKSRERWEALGPKRE